MKKRTFVSLLVVVLNSYCCASLVDQTQNQYDNSWFIVGSGRTVAQTFTPSMAGQLDSVSIKFGNFQREDDIPQYSVDVSIVETIALIPSGNILGTATVNAFEEDFTDVDFSSLSIYLNAGNRYGIIVACDDLDVYDEQSTQWRSSLQDVYFGGQAWVWLEDQGWIQEFIPSGSSTPVETYYDKDFAFRTYIVPEPVTFLFLSLGIVFNLRKKK